MRKEPIEGYEKVGEGKCWEMFHPELQGGPYCQQDVEHTGSHKGFEFKWNEEPKVEVEVAAQFMELIRKIPNGNHEIWLNDDATVGMTMKGMADAVRFNSIRFSDDA